MDSDSCELLLAFEQRGSLSAIAQELRKDPTVVLRQLQKISGKAPVLEKMAGRWQLSPFGREVIQWAQNAMDSQSNLFQGPKKMTIATTAEFSARILSPQIKKILEGQGRIIKVVTDGSSSEGHILAGRADVAIECGRPLDPLIRFQLILEEPFSVVASPSFIKKEKIEGYEALLASPYVEFDRDPAAQLLGLDASALRLTASFSDISSVREACISGVGWCVLPNYSTRDWVASRKLARLHYAKSMSRKFGLWWHRDRRSIRPVIESIAAWMRQQDLN